MSKPIPVAKNSKTLKQIKRDKRAAYRRLRDGMKVQIENTFSDLEDENLEALMKVYMQMMTAEEVPEFTPDVLHQMGLLCAKGTVDLLVGRFS